MPPEQPAATKDLVGRTIAGRYTIKRVLGTGGMATVYLAERAEEPKSVALKIMAPELVAEKNFAKRFQREAKAASSVKHANCVTIFEYGVDGDLSFIAMELVRGDDLYVMLERDGAMEEVRAVRILADVCDALAVAHELGIVHRDLKPENIMIVKDPATPDQVHVKVLDFGIAKLVEPPDQPAPIKSGQRQNSQLTSAGTLLGTPAYMSPEQCALMQVDARSDIYTCGVLLFQMLTGKLPFEGETPLHTATLHIHREPPKPTSLAPKMNPKLEAIILKALAKKPEERFESAAQLAEELRALLPALPKPDPAKKPLPPRKKFSQTMPWAGGDPPARPDGLPPPAAGKPAPPAPPAPKPPTPPAKPVLGGGALGRGAGLGVVPRPVVKLKQDAAPKAEASPPPAPASEPDPPTPPPPGEAEDRQRTLVRENVVLPPVEGPSAITPAPRAGPESGKPRSGPTGTQVMDLGSDDAPRLVGPHPTLKSEGFDPNSMSSPLSGVDVLMPSGPLSAAPSTPPAGPPSAQVHPSSMPVPSGPMPSVQGVVDPSVRSGAPVPAPLRQQLAAQLHTLPIGSTREVFAQAIANDPTVESGIGLGAMPQVVIQPQRPQIPTMEMAVRPNVIEPFPIQRPQARGLASLTGPQVLLLGFFAGAIVMAMGVALYFILAR